jgi:predicted transcriptional regulator
MYKYKVQKKHESNTKNSNLIRRLKETEMEIQRLRLKFSWFEDEILYANKLMNERINNLEDKIEEQLF